MAKLRADGVRIALVLRKLARDGAFRCAPRQAAQRSPQLRGKLFIGLSQLFWRDAQTRLAKSAPVEARRELDRAASPFSRTARTIVRTVS